MEMIHSQFCNFKALHESIMATSGAATSVVSGEQSGAAASPVVSGEQNTPLTNNLSERSKQVSTPQHQNLPSSQNMVVKSTQYSPILEPAVLKAAVNDPIAKKVEKVDLGPCHSPNLSPVNLDENFAAANEVDVGNHSNPESPSSDSEMCVVFDKPVGYHEASNRSLEKYSLAEAWKMDALVTSHSKFSGRSTSTHMFLNPEVHCASCSFPQSSTFICIGNKNYINKCSKTNVWLDGNFIAGFTTLLYHYAHSSGTSLVGNEKNLPQLIHAIFSKQQLAISGIKPLPKDVDRLVAILHNDGHYIVLEVNIPERKFLIYDGLSRELLQWKDHIIIVLKKCMLLDLSFDSSSTVCVPDAAVPPVFSCSRKPRYIINGYSITFSQSSPSYKKMEEWRLERGYFIHQMDGFNCGPIACLKVMELFGIVTIPYPQDFYENYNVCKIVMGQWEKLLEYCDSNLVLMFKTKPVKESTCANEEVVDANENGLNFAPLCNSFCFTKKKECDHKKKKVQINNVGKYVQFPSKWYHQGYFNDVLGKVVVQAQLFARPSIAPEDALSMHTPFKRTVGS